MPTTSSRTTWEDSQHSSIPYVLLLWIELVEHIYQYHTPFSLVGKCHPLLIGAQQRCDIHLRTHRWWRSACLVWGKQEENGHGPKPASCRALGVPEGERAGTGSRARGSAFRPVDLIPDFIPVLGYLDDLVLVPLGIALAVRMIPPHVLAYCRLQAQEIMSEGTRRTNWAAAILIITLWLLPAALAVALVTRVIKG